MPTWSVGRITAFEPLHNGLKGEVEKLVTAAFQLPQLLLEAPGEQPAAASLAAQFADATLIQLAPSVEAVIKALPSSRLHAGWSSNYFLSHITRDRGERKPRLERVQPVFMNAWHMKDLLKTIVMLLLQPLFFGSENIWATMLAGLRQRERAEPPAYRPRCIILDFHTRSEHQVGPIILRDLLIETFCLYVEWYKLREKEVICDRGIAELTVLFDEWLEQAKAALPSLYRTTWKTHQCDHAGASRRDLGNSNAQRSEHAHKFGKLLYAIATNKSAHGFTGQLAGARDLLVAAQVLRHQQSLSADASDLLPKAGKARTHSDLVSMRKALRLKLDVNDDLKVIGLSSESVGISASRAAVLLNDRGYQHLYWSILCYLNEIGSGTLGAKWQIELNPATNFDMTLSLFRSVRIGSSNSFRDTLKAEATPYVEVPPLSTEADAKCVAVVVDDIGTTWLMQPTLLFQMTTADGTCYNLVYGRWFDYALGGEERLQLPLPLSFPIHQWAEAKMGVRAHTNSPSYSVVDVSRILHVEPIVPIGVAPAAGNQRKRKRRTEASPSKQLKHGAPLFANNIHVWL